MILVFHFLLMFIDKSVIVDLLVLNNFLIRIEYMINPILSLLSHLSVSILFHLDYLFLPSYPIVSLYLLLYFIQSILFSPHLSPKTFFSIPFYHIYFLIPSNSVFLLLYHLCFLVPIFSQLAFYQVHLILFDMSGYDLLMLLLNSYLKLCFLVDLFSLFLFFLLIIDSKSILLVLQILFFFLSFHLHLSLFDFLLHLSYLHSFTQQQFAFHLYHSIVTLEYLVISSF